MADERRFVRTARRWQLLYWLEVILLVSVLAADFIVEYRLGVRRRRGTLADGGLRSNRPGGNLRVFAIRLGFRRS